MSKDDKETSSAKGLMERGEWSTLLVVFDTVEGVCLSSHSLSLFFSLSLPPSAVSHINQV
jgi:hypothetical protein